MANPWLKKNPLMSMWMSAANRTAGSLRGHATVQAKRQVTTALTQAMRENLKMWSDAMTSGTGRPKRKP